MPYLMAFRLIGVLGIVALIGFVGWRVHSSIYESGRASAQQECSAAMAELAEAHSVKVLETQMMADEAVQKSNAALSDYKRRASVIIQRPRPAVNSSVQAETDTLSEPISTELADVLRQLHDASKAALSPEVQP